MSKAASTGNHRVLQICPSCRNREPKEVVKIDGRKRLYCVACGKDFAQKRGMGVFSIFFGVAALFFAFGVVKQKFPQGWGLQKESRTEFVEIEGATTTSDGQMPWVPLGEGSEVDPRDPRKGRKDKDKPKKPVDSLSVSEKEIRKQWGWDSKGSSLNQTPQ